MTRMTSLTAPSSRTVLDMLGCRSAMSLHSAVVYVVAMGTSSSPLGVKAPVPGSPASVTTKVVASWGLKKVLHKHSCIRPSQIGKAFALPLLPRQFWEAKFNCK